MFNDEELLSINIWEFGQALVALYIIPMNAGLSASLPEARRCQAAAQKTGEPQSCINKGLTMFKTEKNFTRASYTSTWPFLKVISH